MEEIALYRKKIQEIDKIITKLLSERLNSVKSISKIKKENNLPIVCKDREQELLTMIENELKGDNDAIEYAKSIYKCIFQESREVQKK